MKSTITWWLIFWVQVLGFSVAAFMGMGQKLLAVDPTYISSLIVLVLWGTTFWLGWVTRRRENGSPMTSEIETGYFISQHCISLGLIGTIIGMMLVIDASLGSLGTVAVAEMPKIISKLGVGIGTKLVTTLCGLISCLLLQIQLRNAELAGDHDEQA